MSKVDKYYKEYCEHALKIQELDSSISLLRWDQETHMPKDGATFRANQLGMLSGLKYDWKTADRYGDLLKSLYESRAELKPEQKFNVEKSFQNFNKTKKYTKDFVVRESKLVSEAYRAWIEARSEKKYQLFSNSLKSILDLRREETEILGYADKPYDALLNEYEEGMTTAKLDVVFTDVKNKLNPFLKEIANKPKPENAFMYGNFPFQKQWDFGLELIKQCGFNFDKGRQDLSVHPFSSSMNPSDVRITTRVDETNFYFMLWSCLHECGHGLYEQGLREEFFGLPMGKSVSLGIHESQSRLYENNLGRSSEFWSHNYPKLQSLFKDSFGGVSQDDFYKAINRVEPSPIRTEADELTYHLHIMIRYEIEKKLIHGELDSKDLSEVWNEMYKQYLNIDIKNDNEGVLQDIHWSHGSFGYFPTYSLGSFFAAQFYAHAKEELPEFDKNIKTGNLIPLLEWLNKNVHRHGQRYQADELCERITGKPLDFDYFMQYAKEKFSSIYNL
ncbi:MAG: carboxypeptidase M32 [Chitinophagaceae bacterium]|nr:MAG: carboxypeptidase M32 [Chitinophagaceae bacterium]